MQNVVVNTCEKFHYDRSRNDKASGNLKSDNNKKNNKKTLVVALGDAFLFPGLKPKSQI